MIFRARVEIRLRDGVLDPQGSAICEASRDLGFEGLSQIRVGKLIEVDLEAEDLQSAESDLRRLCDSLLANPVIESFEFAIGEIDTSTIDEADSSGAQAQVSGVEA